MHAFAYNLTKNTEEAKDLYQETSYRALNNLDKVQPDTNFKAWVFTIMKNLFINGYRRKIKSNTILDNTENQFLLNSASHAASDEQVARLPPAITRASSSSASSGLSPKGQHGASR